MARTRVGRVALVGAGPGDPGLLTLRGREALERSDVVVYDRLTSPGILRFAPARAIRIPAESLGPHGAERQRAINRALVREARRGRFVVRLKGGDPFTFGRGREEVEALRASGLECEVVPGVTSVTAGPEAVGIPLTHRDQASLVTIATGHEARGKDTVPWERIAATGGTIVVLMCSDRMRELARRLRRGGLSADTPAAVVSRATLPDQEVRLGTLETIGDYLRRRPVRLPALLIVGKVAGLAERHRSGLPRGVPSRRRLLR